MDDPPDGSQTADIFQNRSFKGYSENVLIDLQKSLRRIFRAKLYIKRLTLKAVAKYCGSLLCTNIFNTCKMSETPMPFTFCILIFSICSTVSSPRYFCCWLFAMRRTVRRSLLTTANSLVAICLTFSFLFVGFLFLS